MTALAVGPVACSGADAQAASNNVQERTASDDFI
jgi:hypothetical protein